MHSRPTLAGTYIGAPIHYSWLWLSSYRRRNCMRLIAVRRGVAVKLADITLTRVGDLPTDPEAILALIEENRKTFRPTLAFWSHLINGWSWSVASAMLDDNGEYRSYC